MVLLKFQSTLLQEERLKTRESMVLNFLFQSTLLQEERHCPPCDYYWGDWNFNPRSYKRSDFLYALSWTTRSLFQSTLLQEERRLTGGWNHEYFHISIHAPTRGATTDMGRMDFCRMISIHAPTRGATGILLIPAYKHSIFQSTLLQEERRLQEWSWHLRQ